MPEKRDLGARLRRARKDCRFTLKDLAARAGVSATHLSEIERGLTSPTVQVLVKIASALDRPTEFFLESSRLELVSCLHSEHRGPGLPVGDGAQAFALTAGVVGHRLVASLLRLAPGTNNEVEEPPHAGSVAILVLSGSVRVVVDGRPIVLEAGDALRMSCERAHGIQNTSAVTAAEVVWVADCRPNLQQRGTQRARAGAAGG